MIQKTFLAVETGDNLTLLLTPELIYGRQDKLPGGMWWEVRWSELQGHLANSFLPALTREAFQWALKHKDEVSR